MAIRGIRQGIPGGYILGRKGGRRGPVGLLPITPGGQVGTGASGTATAGGFVPQVSQPNGNLAFNAAGVWSATASYNPGDVVTYNGGAYVNYVAVLAPGPNPSPDTDDTHWFSQGAVNTVDSNFTISAGQLQLNMHQITNSLSGNVSLNNVASFFDGPSVAQGTAGTWFVSGTVSMVDSTAAATFEAKLWDGTTIIASSILTSGGGNFWASLALSGFISSPAGNLRISARDITSVNGLMAANASTGGKDSTITAIRIG